MGETLEDNGVSDETSKYFLVLMKDVSGYTWYKPAVTCTAVVAAKILLH